MAPDHVASSAASDSSLAWESMQSDEALRAYLDGLKSAQQRAYDLLKAAAELPAENPLSTSHPRLVPA